MVITKVHLLRDKCDFVFLYNRAFHRFIFASCHRKIEFQKNIQYDISTT